VNRRAELASARGSHEGSFQAYDWMLIVAVAAIWGSSFLWIAIGVDSMSPGVVAFLRVVLGSLALFMIPAARRRIDRSDWWAVVIVAVAGNAGPALLFALAETELESAVVGMINSAAPIPTLVIAFMLGNRAIGSRHVGGLLIGFAGVLLMALPSVVGANAPILSVFYVILAVFGYGLTGNVLVPLQQKYGSMAVVANAQALGAILLLPVAIGGVSESEFSLKPVLAVVFLGIVGTGFARAIGATVTGRAGAQRGSVFGYFVPIVAIILGVVVRDESVELIQLAGLGLVLIAGFLVAKN
jgi:drug/metabolite transporter (DMT)-like permease